MSAKKPKRTSAAKKTTKKTAAAASAAKCVDSAEERAFTRSLRAHGQLHEGKGPLPPGATHVLRKKRGHSKKTVQRKRFSYV